MGRMHDIAEYALWAAVDVRTTHIPEAWGDKEIRRGIIAAAGVLAIGAAATIYIARSAQKQWV